MYNILFVNKILQRYKLILFWLAVYGILFSFLQVYSKFYFYYIEQNHFFQNTWSFVFENLLEPGGLASVISGFLIQFFLLPYAGAAITAALLTIAGWLTYGIIGRITSPSGWLVACLLPVIALMLIQFNPNYLPFGTIAFLLTLINLYFVLSIKDFHRRLVFHLLATFALFYTAGSVYMLYAFAVTIYEFFKGSLLSYPVLLILLEALLIGTGSVYFLTYTAYRFAFLPDHYFHYKWLPGTLIYLSWVCVLLMVTAACLIRKRKIANKNIRMYVIVQILMVAGCCWWGILMYGFGERSKIIALDYYCRTEQWDSILELCKEPLNDYLSLGYANMALAKKGELGDKAFSYDQAGIEGLIFPWDKSAFSSMFLSDVYDAMKHLALSQKMAFEAFVITGSPRMLQRLVQTNLIYGAYPVAEKYICILENMYCYRKWAKAHRKFLYHDVAIELDAALGSKRKSLAKANFLSRIDGLDMDLQQLAIDNPCNRTAMEYAGVMYLLSKDMENFRKLLENCQQTEIFPVLPVSFQEAILIFSLKEPGYWTHDDISEVTKLRFFEFLKDVSANKNPRVALSVSLKPSYGDTYWYYHMFK